jgi:hypothetical protein
MERQGERPSYADRAASILISATSLLILFIDKSGVLSSEVSWLLSIVLLIAFLIAVVLGVSPLVGKARSYVGYSRLKKQRCEIMGRLNKLLQEAHPLFTPDDDASLWAYANALVKKSKLIEKISQQKLESIKSKFGLVSRWHSSLLRTTQNQFDPMKSDYGERVTDIGSLYVRAGWIIEELQGVDLSEDPELKRTKAYFKSTEGRYNHHINKVREVFADAERIGRTREMPINGWDFDQF